MNDIKVFNENGYEKPKEVEFKKAIPGKLPFKPTGRWVLFGVPKKIQSGSLLLSAPTTKHKDESGNDWVTIFEVGKGCGELKAGMIAYAMFQNRPIGGEKGLEQEFGFDGDLTAYDYTFFLLGEHDFIMYKEQEIKVEE